MTNKIEEAVAWLCDVAELKAAPMGKLEARPAKAILAELERLRKLVDSDPCLCDCGGCRDHCADRMGQRHD